jgi:hypothetical protein
MYRMPKKNSENNSEKWPQLKSEPLPEWEISPENPKFSWLHVILIYQLELTANV